MKRLFVASLCVVSVLCTSFAWSSFSAEEKVPAVAVKSRVERYPVDLERRFQLRVTQRQATALPAGDTMADGELSLSGVVSLTGRRTSAGAEVVVLRVESLTSASASLMGQPVPLDGLNGSEAWAHVNADGQLQALQFTDETPVPVRYLLQGLAGDVFVPTPDARSSHVVEKLAMGDVDTTLIWRGETSLRRERTRFVEWRLGHPVPDSISMHDGADVSFDSAGLLTSMTAESELLGQTAQGRMLARRRSVLSLQFLDARERDAEVLAVTTHQVLRPVGGVKSEVDQQRALLEAQTAGVTFEHVLTAFTKYDDPRAWNDRAEFVLRAVAVLQLHPERSKELVPVFQNAKSDQMRAQVLDVLASAGHPQAQAALVDSLKTGATDALVARQLFQRLSLVKQPTPETLQFALEQHAAGVGEDRNARAYVLGSLAFNARGTSPQLSATMVDQLVDDVTQAESPKALQATLRALGNSGDARALDIAKEKSADADVTVRAAALSSLRRVTGPDVETVVRERLANERSREVQSAAFDALRGRALTDETLLELRGLVTQRRLQPGSERALLNLASEQKTASPALIQTLQALLLLPGLSATTRAEVQATLARFAS
ncbi:MAG: HEAT repeat domain-containing protein [Archangium sp.]